MRMCLFAPHMQGRRLHLLFLPFKKMVPLLQLVLMPFYPFRDFLRQRGLVHTLLKPRLCDADILYRYPGDLYSAGTRCFLQ